ncbi:LLM class flavin-dependent oxidoreductase [Nonomuraea dietziae]|uniref:LLM class flavin-dependent oxidoreductase n=1 Tax=Nonomuraea dietziae TaxID=65515 RepID=UPI00341EF66D
MIHLAVALDGAGWHPAAWRESTARPEALLSARYWAGLVAEAERGLLDFVTIEDAFALQSTLLDGPDERTDQVRGRLDAVLLASRIAPLTSGIGLVPTATTTHTEPFHVAAGIATLDHISNGRAGWRPQVSARATEAAHFGRRRLPSLGEGRLSDFAALEGDDRARALREETVRDLFEEAGEAVEVARRLWDSWEEDAEIRDVATGRFIDRDKLHYIDFAGRFFSVKGPSITPRPPQGQPVVTALAHSAIPYDFAARHADVVHVTPRSRQDAARIVAALPCSVKVFADLVVFLGRDAQARKARFDELDGGELVSDAAIFTGTAEELADLLLDWREAGVQGFRLRPGALPYDLKAISRGLTGALRRRGEFRREYEARTLRGLLGLPHPANRYGKAS